MFIVTNRRVVYVALCVSQLSNTKSAKSFALLSLRCRSVMLTVTDIQSMRIKQGEQQHQHTNKWLFFILTSGHCSFWLVFESCCCWCIESPPGYAELRDSSVNVHSLFKKWLAYCLLSHYCKWENVCLYLKCTMSYRQTYWVLRL